MSMRLTPAMRTHERVDGDWRGNKNRIIVSPVVAGIMGFMLPPVGPEIVVAINEGLGVPENGGDFPMQLGDGNGFFKAPVGACVPCLATVTGVGFIRQQDIGDEPGDVLEAAPYAAQQFKPVRGICGPLGDDEIGFEGWQDFNGFIKSRGFGEFRRCVRRSHQHGA